MKILLQEPVFNQVVKRVKEGLDFTACMNLISVIKPVELRRKVTSQIHESVDNHIEFCFWFGWRVAKNPFEFLFGDGDIGKGLVSTSVYEWMAVQQHEFIGLESLASGGFDLDSAHGDLVVAADEAAFALGFQSATDPSWLIFAQDDE